MNSTFLSLVTGELCWTHAGAQAPSGFLVTSEAGLVFNIQSDLDQQNSGHLNYPAFGNMLL